MSVYIPSFDDGGVLFDDPRFDFDGNYVLQPAAGGGVVGRATRDPATPWKARP